MDSVNKTLYIPLYGKAYVSRRGILLRDAKAEEIWAAEGFPLRGKAKSKWLAYSMGMRAVVFDRWLKEQQQREPGALILHIGCGMDSRIHRVGTNGHLWFDVDFPEVIAERRRFYSETDTYHMIGADVREKGWLSRLPDGKRAIVVMEGVSMYLTAEERRALLRSLTERFPQLHLLMDVYTVFGAKASQYKNPVNEVGVTRVYGVDSPEEVACGTGLAFVAQHDLTPEDLIAELSPWEQRFFRPLFAGSVAGKIYRLYEYGTLLLGSDPQPPGGAEAGMPQQTAPDTAAGFAEI